MADLLHAVLDRQVTCSTTIKTFATASYDSLLEVKLAAWWLPLWLPWPLFSSLFFFSLPALNCEVRWLAQVIGIQPSTVAARPHDAQTCGFHLQTLPLHIAPRGCWPAMANPYVRNRIGSF